MRHAKTSISFFVLTMAVAMAAPSICDAAGNATIERGQYDIPKITAANDYDALFALGYVHAQDRLFQMDYQRRAFSGRSAEMFGAAALAQDIELRTLGLDRAAAASMSAVSTDAMVWLTAYADGVNAYLANESLPLPPEYGVLELTRAGVPPWTPVDSMVIAKGLAFQLSFGLEDIDFTRALLTFQGVGAAAGFDGTALFFEDLYRTAPFDPSISIPDFSPAKAVCEPGATMPSYLGSKTLGLIESYRDRIAGIDMLAKALRPRTADVGSNWWLTSGSLTESGYAILANDPHLSLSQPAIFYEAHLVVTDTDNPMEVYGVSFPGAPMIVQGCTPSLCWGSTVHPMDVTDVYQEKLALSTSDQLPIATMFDGEWEFVQRIPQTFYANQIGDGTADNLVNARVPKKSGGITFVVPRRNHGPIVAVDSSDFYNITGISVQYTGWGPTREADAFRIWARAESLEDFEDGLQYFDVGSQNWGVATVTGDIAYYTSAEMPIREDLQTMMAPDGGIPPFLIRDGTHQLHHEWMPVANPQPGQSLPYEVLPFAEMPHEINPERGYILNANNDPIGTSLDNNPLNQLRPGGGLYYLSRDYARGFRMGRLQSLYDNALATGQTFDVDTIKAFQSNNQLLDAEVFAPQIVAAFDALAASGDLPADANANLVVAIDYLRSWDFSTPTGIAAGYDPGDDPDNLPDPSQAEINASVAATLYSTWRGQMVKAVIDQPLLPVGLAAFAPPSDLAMTALRNLVDNFDTNGGVGASGIPFIPGGDLELTMIRALSDALDLLEGGDFAPAFGGSTDVGSYRWGMLHRIVFEHVLGQPFSIPVAGGLANLGPGLPGVARSGGFGAVDASSHSARADAVNEFMFGHGPARRFVGHLMPGGVMIYQTIPGGASGVFGSPHQADALMLWLTNDHHETTLGGGSP